MKIGPKTMEVVMYIAADPGHNKSHYARLVGPHGSLMYGFQTVNRAINAELITDLSDSRPGFRKHYKLYLTEKGRKLMENAHRLSFQRSRLFDSLGM